VTGGKGYRKNRFGTTFYSIFLGGLPVGRQAFDIRLMVSRIPRAERIKKIKNEGAGVRIRPPGGG
jgi:hypothetical protein